jgi:hypothetical protein
MHAPFFAWSNHSYQGEYKDHEAMEYIVKDDETMEYNQESKYFPVRRFLKRMSRR